MKIAAALTILLGLAAPTLAAPGPDLTIDLTAGRHAISPDIYGMNDNPYDTGLGKELQVPVSRWGGDATTRYNWKVDASNSGDDWFFMAGTGKDNPMPGESADKFVLKAKGVGGKALLTIPVIDYIDSTSQWNCSYPVSLFGPQEKVNPYVHPIVGGQQTDAGNGRTPDGKPIVLTRDEILRVHVPNSTTHQQAWIAHLKQRFGNAAHHGVAVFELDNEPGGWANTHRDIHPDVPTYQEIIAKSLPYARAIKQADPTAAIDGPGDFGWAVYKGDTAKNGGLFNAELYLKRFNEESRKAGKRLLDYFDEHYYPTAQEGQSDAVRLESTRSLWDPTYVEKNWIGQWNGAISLIPHMRDWVDKYYPGTKLAITEYNWGGLNTLNGALTQADVLGIFGREGLDLATIWGPPQPGAPGAYAFRIYRNYDGHGGKYGSIWVASKSADQGRLAIYGAQRRSDNALTLVVINKTGDDLTSQVRLSHSKPTGAAQVYQYSAADLHAIQRAADQPVAATGFSATFPANSITLIVIPQKR
jgi:hypothetical protein